MCKVERSQKRDRRFVAYELLRNQLGGSLILVDGLFSPIADVVSDREATLGEWWIRASQVKIGQAVQEKLARDNTRFAPKVIEIGANIDSNTHVNLFASHNKKIKKLPVRRAFLFVSEELNHRQD